MVWPFALNVIKKTPDWFHKPGENVAIYSAQNFIESRVVQHKFAFIHLMIFIRLNLLKNRHRLISSCHVPLALHRCLHWHCFNCSARINHFVSRLTFIVDEEKNDSSGHQKSYN